MPRAFLILAVFCSDVVTAWLFGGSRISAAKMPVQFYPARGSPKPYEEVGRPLLPHAGEVGGRAEGAQVAARAVRDAEAARIRDEDWAAKAQSERDAVTRERDEEIASRMGGAGSAHGVEKPLPTAAEQTAAAQKDAKERAAAAVAAAAERAAAAEQAAAERAAPAPQPPASEEGQGTAPAMPPGAVLKEEGAVPPMPPGAFVKEEQVAPPMPPGAFVKEEGVVPPMPPDAIVKREHAVVVKEEERSDGRAKRRRSK